MSFSENPRYKAFTVYRLVDDEPNKYGLLDINRVRKTAYCELAGMMGGAC